MRDAPSRIVRHAAGLLLVGVVTAGAAGLATLPWFEESGITSLTLAIIAGIVLANTAYPYIEQRMAPGVAFAKHTLLRLGIILYGLRLTLQDIAVVGIAGVAIDVLVLASTFALSWWAGTRLLHLDRTTALLIGAGSSICGAAAIMATGPVVRGRPEQVSVAVSTVVLFGTIAIFLYPALYRLNVSQHFFALSPAEYGLLAGSTIHEVAQVVAAGRAVGETAADTAIIAKMVRVMMLAPFLLMLSACLPHRPAPASADADPRPLRRIVIPWFAFGFVAVAIINSFVPLPKPWIGTAVYADTIILTMAMAALGLGTRFSDMRRAGVKPLALAGVLFVWLILGGGAINVGMAALLR